jgi:hypothetical protein
MISKEKLKAQIDLFPEDELNLEELIERLIFIEKLEERIQISENSEATISEVQLKEEIARWSK